jgi:hypothetical protein
MRREGGRRKRSKKRRVKARENKKKVRERKRLRSKRRNGGAWESQGFCTMKHGMRGQQQQQQDVGRSG